MAMLGKVARRLGLNGGLEPIQPAAPEVVLNPPKPMVGLFATLTEEQKRRARAGDGSESSGSGTEFKLSERCC